VYQNIVAENYPDGGAPLPSDAQSACGIAKATASVFAMAEGQAHPRVHFKQKKKFFFNVKMVKFFN
jgi:hypothetical protein